MPRDDESTKPVATTETEAAFNMGVMSVHAAGFIENGIPFKQLPPGHTIACLEEYLPKPARIRATVTFTDVASYLDYVTEFEGSETSRTFAAAESHAIATLLDYHDSRRVAPAWCAHKAILNLKLSPEWGLWKGADKRPFSQVAFAEFLEENYEDVVEPDAAFLVEVAHRLEATKTVHFKSGVRLDNGAVQLEYNEVIDGQANGAKGLMKVPAAFKLSIPIYAGHDPVPVEARLRYSIADQKLTFKFLLKNADKLEKAAFDAILTTLKGTLTSPVHLGSYAPGK